LFFFFPFSILARKSRRIGNRVHKVVLYTFLFLSAAI
jgi:hypothetical protein